LIVLVPVLLVGSTSPACACSCQPATEAEYLQRADLVFDGVAVDLDRPLLPGSGTAVSVKFVVESVVKGVAEERVTVRTPAEEAGCGFQFDKGHRYRVYAASGLTTLCAGNRDLGAAPDVPVEGGMPLGLMVAGAAAAGLVMILLMARRRGRHRRSF
jgi:hypothetical protein